MSRMLTRVGVCVVALAFTLSSMPIAQDLDLGAASVSAQRRAGGNAARAGASRPAKPAARSAPARTAPAARSAPNRSAAMQRGGGGGRPEVRSNGRTNVNNSNVRNNANLNRNNNVNRNTNVNVNRNVNVNVDNHGGWDNDWDDHWHPVATAAAITATAMVVGSIVRSIPPNCTTVVVNGVSYSQCGSTWYAPQYSGSNVQYVVVEAPR